MLKLPQCFGSKASSGCPPVVVQLLIPLLFLPPCCSRAFSKSFSPVSYCVFLCSIPLNAVFRQGRHGVGMLTFVSTCTRHGCHADHGVGWGCYRSCQLALAMDATLTMGWGGVGMLSFVSTCARHGCHADHGVGWGGDVNVRVNLHSPWMPR